MTTTAPTFPPLPAVYVLGRDEVGLVAESDGMRYYLTDCCFASAKGSVNVPTGVCCRACYTAIDPMMGGAAMAPDLPNGPLVEVFGDSLTTEQYKHRKETP